MTALYVAGFVSSLVVGTTIGALADVLGRKKMATVACTLSIFGCLTKLASNYAILMLGKIAGAVVLNAD